MPAIWPTLALFATSIALTAGLTRLVLAELLRRKIYDQPNARSSHLKPTPKGGGIALVGVVFAGWLYAGPGPEGTATHAALMCAALVLALVSWRDDLGELPVIVRLAVQLASVALVLSIAATGGFWAEWPGIASLIVWGVLWVWFVNLYNFMDGIDGITGVETIAVGGGVFVLAASGATDPALGLKALVLAGSGLGFLIWNWPPARIFLGDVGSVPLGFLIGWLLLALVQNGHWPAALILPLYYLADSGLTLVRRALRGETVWRAHRQHAYQRALPGEGGHGRISLSIAAANICLAGLAYLSLSAPVAALVASGGVVGGLLWHFERLAARTIARTKD